MDKPDLPERMFLFVGKYKHKLIFHCNTSEWM